MYESKLTVNNDYYRHHYLCDFIYRNNFLFKERDEVKRMR